MAVSIPCRFWALQAGRSQLVLGLRGLRVSVTEEETSSPPPEGEEQSPPRHGGFGETAAQGAEETAVGESVASWGDGVPSSPRGFGCAGHRSTRYPGVPAVRVQMVAWVPGWAMTGECAGGIGRAGKGWCGPKRDISDGSWDPGYSVLK